MRRSDGRFWSVFVFGAACTLSAAFLYQSFYQPPAAQAQIPDSGQQRYEMVQELKSANKKLAEIVGLLTEIRDLEHRQPTTEKPKQRSATP